MSSNVAIRISRNIMFGSCILWLHHYPHPHHPVPPTAQNAPGVLMRGGGGVKWRVALKFSFDASRHSRVSLVPTPEVAAAGAGAGRPLPLWKAPCRTRGAVGPFPPPRVVSRASFARSAVQLLCGRAARPALSGPVGGPRHVPLPTTDVPGAPPQVPTLQTEKNL